jgi:hypothetical protein
MKEDTLFVVLYYAPEYPSHLKHRWEDVVDFDAFKAERIKEDPELSDGAWFAFDIYGHAFRIY